jgi:DNA-binding Lrp family transcriptional regulator
MEEFLEIAEEVDSLFELSRETRLSREKCRRILKCLERNEEVKQGFGFLRDQRDDRVP